MFFNPGFSLFKWKPGQHVGSGNAIKFATPEARAEYEEDERLDKAETEYSDAYKAAKKSDDPAAQSRLNVAKADLDKCIAARTARYDAEYEQEKKESRWKRFWVHTVYGIGWLPLGGYCKIAGMIDESMDTAQMTQEPREWEFRSKAAWKRLLVMIGGVLFNFILAIVIYAGIAYHWGDRYIPFTDAYEGFDFVPSAQEAGFRNGDIPLTADGHALDASESDCLYRLASAKTVTVLRNHADTVTITLPDNFLLKLNEDKGLMSLRVPVVVDRLVS
ncbi:MAG: site-2 protease family protein, partial [Duncaniella sp.]|nr:site-2 protease family protein [Duncaniella sp.]